VQQASLVDLRGWPSRQIAVIAFTKPRITGYRKRAIAERDLGGAKGTCEIRAEYGCEMIVTSTHAKRTGLFLACGRQSDVEPAGGKTCFVVEARRVSFKNQSQTRIARHDDPDP
jgi:hypothetical protein